MVLLACSFNEANRGEELAHRKANASHALNCREPGGLDWPVIIDYSTLRMHLKRFRRAACGLLPYWPMQVPKLNATSLCLCCGLAGVRYHLLLWMVRMVSFLLHNADVIDE